MILVLRTGNYCPSRKSWKSEWESMKERGRVGERERVGGRAWKSKWEGMEESAGGHGRVSGGVDGGW